MTVTDETRKTSVLRRSYTFFREALRDNQTDFTQEPVRRGLGLLAIPMMLEMGMEAIFAVVDIAFVSRLGTNAIAAVGLTEAMITVLYAVAIGLGMGVTAMVSRRIGARDPIAAAYTVGQAIWIGALLAAIIGVVGVVMADDLLRMMGASDEVIAEGSGFTAVLLGGNASILYLFLLNAAFRGAGDAPVALRSLALANGLNLVLDPCFIFGLGPFPELGVTGAAVATTIGRGVGCIYLFYYLFAGKGRLEFRLRNLALSPSLAWRMIRVSIGGVGQFLIATSSWILVIRIIAMWGSAPVAAYTIAIRMIEFVFLPAWGLGNAAATLVGQNLGAARPDRAEESVWVAARYNVAFMTVLGSLFFVFAPQIVSSFSNDPDILRYGVDCLRILGLGYPMYAVGMIVTQALNGAGDTRTPSILNLIVFWLTQIPLAYYLAASIDLGPNGVFWAIVVSESLLTLLAVAVFRRGAWRLQEV